MFSRCQQAYHKQPPAPHEPLHLSTATAPQDFVCPLTLEIMTDPVMDHDGHNYERAAIMEWLAEGNAICPISCKPMRATEDLIPNDALKTRIRRWVSRHQRNNASHQNWDDEDVIDVDQSQNNSTAQDTGTTTNNRDISLMELGKAGQRQTDMLYGTATADTPVTTISDSSVSPSPASLPPPVIHSSICKAHTARAMHSMLLPQELHAMELMRDRSRIRRAKQRRAFVMKSSVGISLSLLCILVVMLLVKYIGAFYHKNHQQA